ncbi:MAG TPA: class I SAM-dependent methyltransferase [Humisphaera sp.]|jgi:SAM-dependent methyltransferase|nr:class I SAM-dependent methyltransferase [Humisphaera sp.]
MLDQDVYSTDFYQSYRNGSLSSARKIVPQVLRFVPCKSVVDVGCGIGTWLRVFQEQGINDCLGIDGEHVDVDLMEVSPRQFRALDLRFPINLDRRFDLVVSLEVAEHLPAESADLFVETLTSLGDVVLFSAAIPFQRGNNHINEQWPQYWAKKFAARGYVTVDCIRRFVWDDADVEPWYAQNTLVYVKESRLADYPALASFHAATRDEDCLALVHPRLYLMVGQQAQQSGTAREKLERIPVKKILSALPTRFFHAVTRRMKNVTEVPPPTERRIPVADS